MTDLSKKNLPADNSPTTRITSLATLRALQKATKQIGEFKNENVAQNKSEVTKPKIEEVDIKVKQKDSPPRSNKKSPLRNPDEVNNYELRKTFQTALSKLYTIETKDLALNELKTIIMNNLTPRNLRIFLSSLSEYKKVDNPNTQEIEVFLLGFLANQYKEELIDPLDKSPSLLKTCFRVIESIHTYFKVPAQNVSAACGYSIQQVYANCLRRESVDKKSLVLYEPLATIISGGTDRISQTTASVCLCDLLLAVIQTQDREFLEDIRQKFITMFLKVNFEISDLVKALGILLRSTDIRMSGSRLNKIIEKLIKYAQTTSSAYVIKIEVSSTLSIIASKLIEIAESFIGNLHEEVIAVLKVLSKDRLIKVQNAANEALKLWITLKTELQGLEVKKMTRDLVEHNPDEIIKQRTGIDINQESDIGKLLENVSSPPHGKMMSEEDADNPYILDKLKKGLKKGSGTGGGFVVLEKDKRPSSAVLTTENRKKQNIRDQIQNPNRKEKFDLSVKYPGMEFAGVTSPSNDNMQPKSVKSSLINHATAPSEMSFNPFDKTSPRGSSKTMYVDRNSQELLSQVNERAAKENKTMEAWHGPKKERQIELTQQLLALQNQGYIKNVPKGQIVNSIEGPLSHYASQISPTFNNSQAAAGNQRSQVSSNLAGDSFDVKQFDVTNAFSQVVDSQNGTIKSQQKRTDGFKNFSQMEEVPSSRTHKDFLIRSNKNLPRHRGGPGSQTGGMRSTDGKGYVASEGDLDLEDTLPFDAFEQSNHVGPREKHASSLNPPDSFAEALAKVWEEALVDLERKNIESAYERILSTGDDIYLMRLMSKTGPCLEQLSRKTALAVTNRTTKLIGTNFMDNLFMDVARESFDLDLIEQLTIDEQTQLLDELYILSANENVNGREANNLYSVLLAQTKK